MASTEIPHAFPALDGLRGIAAILVVIFHCRITFLGFDNLPGNDGYLAVDLFFVISGFVLAHAYLPRFQQGMTPLTFMRIRLIRLYPLYFLGFLAGAMVAATFVGKDIYSNFTNAQFFSAVALEAVMIPQGHVITVHNFVFGMNAPAWSLLFELLVNVLFVCFWRRLSLSVLMRVLVVSGVVFAACVSYWKMTDLGAFWDGERAVGGVFRFIFSFSAGLAIYDLHRAGRLRFCTGKCTYLLCVAFLIAYLLWPVSDGLRGLYDLLFIFFLSPALVAAGVTSDIEARWLKPFTFLGAVSYALYAVHAPFLFPVRDFVLAHSRLPAGQAAWLTACVLLPLLIGLCVVIDRAYDRPLRKALMARFEVTQGKTQTL